MHPGYYMHPLHFAGRRFGLFPRLFWFGFGAFAATWWHKHHKNEEFLCSRRQPQITQRADEPKEWQSRSLPPPSYPPPPPPARAESGPWPVDKFDREKIRELGTQATDALADASEAMLESAFSTLEILRNRLNEQRAAKQKQQEASRAETEFPRPS